MNVLFANYSDFTSNSLNHIGLFADALSAQGHSCVVAVPENKASVSVVTKPRFIPATFAEVLQGRPLFPDGRRADILHAWTPRESVRRFVVAHQSRWPSRVIVHLEDNEEFLLESYTGRPLAELRRLGMAERRRLLHRSLADPVRMHQLLHLADGITLIVEELRRFAPAGTPTALLEPALDPAFFEPAAGGRAREELGLEPQEKVVVLTGSATFANLPEMAELYRAIALLNRSGVPTRLVRTGIWPENHQAALPDEAKPYVLDLGFVDRRRIPGLLALADVLVQPGRAGPFNDYRLPSKVPEFLASGRPVVLPASNIGRALRDGEDALLLHSGTPEEIAACCRRVFGDAGLARRLGSNAAAFARKRFDLPACIAQLLGFYGEIQARPARAKWGEVHPASGEAVSVLARLMLETGGVAERDTAVLLDQIRLLEEEHAVLTGRADRRDDLLRALEGERANVRRLAERVDRRERSLSWRWTAPLRAIRRVLVDPFSRRTQKAAPDEPLPPAAGA